MQSIGTILLSLAAIATAAPAENLPRAVSSDNSRPFGVYAYGTGIGGLSIWSNLTFSVPAEGTSDHDVGFVSSNSTSSDRQTSGFMFYGTFIFVESSSGAMESLWYATPSSIDGIYSLKWNETGDSSTDKIILTLKKTPPSNASKTKTRDA
ncbi:cytochrome P450 protein [Colletotrichum tofieldiae]|nr:cytochrome P450 protein [Colletotrichum tofieldiae]